MDFGNVQRPVCVGIEQSVVDDGLFSQELDDLTSIAFAPCLHLRSIPILPSRRPDQLRPRQPFLAVLDGVLNNIQAHREPRERVIDIIGTHTKVRA